MVAENFLQALRQAMSPKAHDAIDNAMSSNNRMKFQGGGEVNPTTADDYFTSPEFFIDRGDNTILDIIKGIEGADIAGMDPYSRLFLDEAIQQTGQERRNYYDDFSDWYTYDNLSNEGIDTRRERYDIAKLVNLVSETMGDYDTGRSLAKRLGFKTSKSYK